MHEDEDGAVVAREFAICMHSFRVVGRRNRSSLAKVPWDDAINLATEFPHAM